MKTCLLRLLGLILVLGLLFSTNSSPVRADDGQPPTPPTPYVPPQPPRHNGPNGPQQDSQGGWYMAGEQARKFTASDQAMLLPGGGPDDYGYTWANLPGYTWVDASAGTNTGIDNSTEASGPINLGFSFDYYGNTYTQLYITRHGYVTFDLQSSWSQSGQIPFPEEPDNVIAPYWSPEGEVTGYVHYLTGNSPDHWFAVEWNRVKAFNTEFTFELILHENGDIVFQYDSMTVNGDWWCPSSGIEDEYGTDGLSITAFCENVASDHAVQITHPSPAHLKVNPHEQGGFTSAGGVSEFSISIENNGTMGADTYELLTTSDWAVSPYAEDGTTPLVDTNGSGGTDTGSISQGSTKTIVVKVATPEDAKIGDSNTAALEICSTLDSNRCKTVLLQSAVPTAFAQVFSDNNDGFMKLDLIYPSGQRTIEMSDAMWGENPAVAEAPNGNFAYLWDIGSYTLEDGFYVRNLQFMILNRYGGSAQATANLTDNTSASYQIIDRFPAVAIAPDGHIGVIWSRYEYRNIGGDDQWRYNIFFAVLDAGGNISVDPTSLTNYTTWGSSSGGIEVPEVYTPVIAATGDNRFVLSWTRWSNSPCAFNDCGLENVYYTIRNTSGSEVKGVTQFTTDAPSDTLEGYYRSRLNAVSGNKVLITWTRYSDADVYYAVLDSAGNEVKAKTNLSNDGPGANSDWEADAAQLSDGKIVVAWMGGAWYYPTRNQIRFAVLNSSYDIATPATTLTNTMDLTGEAYVSVAADRRGRAALTWGDWSSIYRPNLYYALVDGSGGILTPPMISHVSEVPPPDRPWFFLNFTGYGNASSIFLGYEIFLPLLKK